MWGGLGDHLEENPFDHIVPIMGGSTIHKMFSSGTSIHLLGKMGLQLEVL